MAKFKIIFDACYFGKTPLCDYDLYTLLEPGLYPEQMLLSSFSDDNPTFHIIKKEDELHLILSFFLNAARHRGECLSYLCNALADYSSHWYERRYVSASAEATVLLQTPDGYEPPDTH